MSCVSVAPWKRLYHRDIKGVVEGEPCKLLEAVAHRACAAVLAQHSGVREMRLAIRKLCIPGVPSVVESVGEADRRWRGRWLAARRGWSSTCAYVGRGAATEVRGGCPGLSCLRRRVRANSPASTCPTSGVEVYRHR